MVRELERDARLAVGRGCNEIVTVCENLKEMGQVVGLTISRFPKNVPDS